MKCDREMKSKRVHQNVGGKIEEWEKLIGGKKMNLDSDFKNSRLESLFIYLFCLSNKTNKARP